MTTIRTRQRILLLGACVLFVWPAPAWANKGKQDKPKDAEVVKEGKIQVVRGLNSAEPQLTDSAEKRWLVTGAAREETLRLHGHKVKVWGTPGRKKLMVPTIKVSRYEIIDSGGRKPLVGRLARKDKRTIVLERKEGNLTISSTNRRFLRRLARRVGCKVWILGELEGTTLKPYKFGWLNCKPPKVLKPRKETK